jgi:hypothetical protein
MRVLIALVAFVATPFVASVSQDRSSAPQLDQPGQCEQQGQNEGEGCTTPPPPPPPACALSAGRYMDFGARVPRWGPGNARAPGLVHRA